MSVRQFVAGVLAERIRGRHVFNGLTGTSNTISRRQLDLALAAADGAYVDVVELVDWSRIMLAAWLRCDDAEHKANTIPCGRCVRDALLCTDRVMDRREPIDDPVLADWPALTAQAIGARRTSLEASSC